REANLPLNFCYSFMADLESLNRNVIGRSVEPRTLPFRRPSIDEIPSLLLFTGVVRDDNGPVLTLRWRSGDELAVPFPKRVIIRESPFEGDRRVLIQARQFTSWCQRLTLGALFLSLRHGIKPVAPAESG